MTDVKKFEAGFNSALKAITKSEQVTKATLMGLSRDVLEALHGDAVIAGDIGYVNRLIAVLTPINRKAATLYFKAFTGFDYSEETKLFSKKNKKRYQDKRADALAFIADPHNNIWTWAERNIEIEEKKFDLTSVTKYMQATLKKANAAGVSQTDVIKALFADGVELDTIMAALADLFNLDVNMPEDKAQA